MEFSGRCKLDEEVCEEFTFKPNEYRLPSQHGSKAITKAWCLCRSDSPGVIHASNAAHAGYSATPDNTTTMSLRGQSQAWQILPPHKLFTNHCIGKKRINKDHGAIIMMYLDKLSIILLP